MDGRHFKNPSARVAVPVLACNTRDGLYSRYGVTAGSVLRLEAHVGVATLEAEFESHTADEGLLG